jgi:hypothetical protein
MCQPEALIILEPVFWHSEEREKYEKKNMKG